MWWDHYKTDLILYTLPRTQVRRHRRWGFILVAMMGLRRLVYNRLGHNNVFGQIMSAARAKHERIDTHANVLSFRLNALPYKHTGSLVRVSRARFRTDLEVVATAGHRQHRHEPMEEEYLCGDKPSTPHCRWRCTNETILSRSWWRIWRDTLATGVVVAAGSGSLVFAYGMSIHSWYIYHMV